VDECFVAQENTARGWLTPAFQATLREMKLHAAAREPLFCPAQQAARKLGVVAVANHDEVVAAFVSELHNAPRPLGAYVFSGVRASSGAETQGRTVAFGQSNPLERADITAAEDGRTPLNTYLN
jgi:hypothetical protein